MRRSTLLLTLTFASVLAAYGCQRTSGAIDGAGFSTLTPSPATRQFIIANDRPFANQVVSHNATCASLSGCAK